jgi:thiol-disulfide isomerase/thioredoxin
VVTGVMVSVAVLAAASTFGMIWKTRNGRMRRGTAMATDGAASGPGPGASRTAGAGPALTEAELGHPLGGRATLVQFSTAFCAPCRATRVILADVAGLVDGVAHVEIDAESRLDLVRRLDIRRTPTVLVLGADGRIARRASGQPRKADVLAALGEALPSSEVG